MVGRVVKPAKSHSWLKEGDLVRKPLPHGSSREDRRSRSQVLVISTDYRDPRKAGFQEYVIASDFNTVRIPPSVSRQAGSTIGVAYVAAALSLGICMGVDFSTILDGPDLFDLIRKIDPEQLPKDIRAECVSGISQGERALPGDWLAIWGGMSSSPFPLSSTLADPIPGSSTSANIAVQLARLAGLKVVTVVDKLRHGLRLANHKTLRPDLLVDSHDPSRAIEIIRANVGKDLRFGLDTTGPDSARSLRKMLTQTVPRDEQQVTPPPSPSEKSRRGSTVSGHLIGLAGLPKEQDENVSYHTVPIKVFHEVPAVGEALVLWLERLLENGLLSPPEVLAVEHGFDGVNRALDRMRQGEIRGGRIVVDLDHETL